MKNPFWIPVQEIFFGYLELSLNVALSTIQLNYAHDQVSSPFISFICVCWLFHSWIGELLLLWHINVWQYIFSKHFQAHLTNKSLSSVKFRPKKVWKTTKTDKSHRNKLQWRVELINRRFGFGKLSFCHQMFAWTWQILWI